MGRRHRAGRFLILRGCTSAYISIFMQRFRLCGGDQRAFRSPFGNLRCTLLLIDFYWKFFKRFVYNYFILFLLNMFLFPFYFSKQSSFLCILIILLYIFLYFLQILHCKYLPLSSNSLSIYFLYNVR